ncbi:hypothetical protein D9M68_678170 [compost metagenome]
MRSMSSSANTPSMIDNPPGSTGMRSGFSPVSLTRLVFSALISARLRRSSPSRVMPWSAGLSFMPLSSISSASARAVPDDPTACSQPAARYWRTSTWISRRAASSACFIA